MKYVWGIVLFLTGFVGASNFVGASFSADRGNSYMIEWESATLEEREAWLTNEASEVARGLKSSLPGKSKGNQVGMQVNTSVATVEHRRIDVELQMKSYGVLAVSQTDARKMFTSHTCPVYRRSILKENSVVIRYTVLDSRGGKVIQFINSPRICARA